MSDSAKTTIVPLEKLAADIGFKALAVYLWEISGVDEPTEVVEASIPDEALSLSEVGCDTDETVDKNALCPLRPKRQKTNMAGFSVLEEEQEYVVSAEQADNMEPTGSHAEVQPPEKESASSMAEKGPPQQASGARLEQTSTSSTAEKGPPQQASGARLEQTSTSSTAEKGPPQQTSGARLEQKSTSSMAEKGPSQQVSGARLSAGDGVPSAADAEMQRSSTEPRTSNLEPTGSHAEVEPPEQKSASSTAVKDPAEQSSNANMSTVQMKRPN